MREAGGRLYHPLAAEQSGAIWMLASLKKQSFCTRARLSATAALVHSLQMRKAAPRFRGGPATLRCARQAPASCPCLCALSFYYSW